MLNKKFIAKIFLILIILFAITQHITLLYNLKNYWKLNNYYTLDEVRIEKMEGILSNLKADLPPNATLGFTYDTAGTDPRDQIFYYYAFQYLLAPAKVYQDMARDSVVGYFPNKVKILSQKLLPENNFRLGRDYNNGILLFTKE